ncbi:helix-turn-helix transcriptional regulator [Arthrobacter globiformis]|uniref:helix-turn-helix transcriptional regulator n=1 Tax=Arthrobacter globiformis TaxID=1665 RepID=UPI000B41BD2E|nr:LuxR family transcriptional regulator [Arthrobacter globiformis]
MAAIRLVGRSAAVESVIASVTQPVRCGSLIIGETGMGKTAVAQAVSDTLRTERPVFRLSGTPALSKMPFNVLAPFLGHLQAGREPTHEEVFRAVCSFLRGQRTKTDQVPLLVVDDAHDVDAESRAVLARLVVSDTARIVVLSPRSSMPIEFMELWTDGFLGRCDLHPLTPDEIHILCEKSLRGKVLRSVSALLGDMSKGNPLIVQELLRHSRADGSLFERNGVWLLAAAPSADLPLLERLRTELRRLSVEEFEVLEAVALAEPLPMDVLIGGGMGHVLDDLRMQELITVSSDVPRSVRLANPLFSEVLRRTVPPARSSELRQKYGEPAEDMSNERLIRHVTWALDCGAPVADDLLVRAARAGNEEFDFQFSLRAAAAVHGSTQRDELLLETAIAHTHLGHHLVARDRLEHLLHESTNLPVLSRAVLWICRMSMTGGDSGQPRGRNILLQGTAERIAALRAGGAGDSELDIVTGLIGLVQDMAVGKSRKVEETLARMARETAGTDIRTRVTSLTLLGNLLNGTGRFTAGRAATLSALTLVQENPAELRMEFDCVFFQHVTGLVLGGYWREAAACLADYRRSCSRNLIYFGAALQLLEGVLAVRRGQVYSGLEQLRPAVEGLRLGRHTEFLPFGLGMMAYAAALCGQTALVDESLASFPEESSCNETSLYLLGEAYSLAAMAVLGRKDDAGERLTGLARQAQASGLPAAERDALALAVCLGDASSADRLAELTSTMEGPMSEALRLYSRAVMARDPEALADTAESARREGFHLLAVSCVEQAVTMLGANADRVRRNEAQVLLRHYRTLLDGPVVLSSHESFQASRLTPREQEIVEFVQSGRSTRDIARALSLSARTVEGHLYRIFAKLGVSSRADLLALEAWPRFAQDDSPSARDW